MANPVHLPVRLLLRLSLLFSTWKSSFKGASNQTCPFVTGSIGIADGDGRSVVSQREDEIEEQRIVVQHPIAYDRGIRLG